MKSIKKFSKAFPVCVVLSCLVAAAGVAGLFVKGINFGIDFQPGLMEEVRIAPPAFDLTYNGSATASIEIKNTQLELIISGTGAENETKEFVFGQYPTVGQMVAALNEVPNVSAVLRNGSNSDTYGLYLDSANTSRLSETPIHVYVPEESSAVTVDEIRDLLASVKGVQVKELGTNATRSYQIRAQITQDNDTGKSENDILQESIVTTLKTRFGADNVAVVKTDFVGSSMSSSLVKSAILLAFATILLIWLYATIRFHWDLALGSIVALVHDFLIMFTFISWFQIEFSTTTLAAVLTIFGYSINATVVILDRVRFNIKNLKTNDFKDILNKSLSETLNRSIITTVTTLFASLSLVFFTTGSIHDFAIVLTIGLLSGCYSSIFIAPAFISAVRSKWQGGENANRVRPKASTAHEVVTE